MSAVHLIKCYDSAVEDDWIRFLLAPLEIVEHSAADFSVVHERAIYCIVGTTGLDHVPPRFLERLAACKSKGLFHVGDEFLAGGYGLYRHFDFVLRNYYASAFRCDGIKMLPLGYARNMTGSAEVLAASKRPLAWSFLGNMNAARASMVAEFRRIAPHHLALYDSRRQKVRPATESEYKDILRASVFAPCPMGNVMLETFRLYEALEAGAIPLLSRRLFMPYHDRVIPGHPIPAFTRWAAACRFANRLLADPAALDALQARLMAWWRDYKSRLQSETCHFVAQGFEGRFRADLAEWRPRTGTALRAWRLVELLKHHDLAAARGRLEIMMTRLARPTGPIGS